MKKINSSKSDQLRRERGFAIEEVITDGVLLDVRENPKYPDQFVEVYRFQNYVWAVIVGVKPDRYITMYRSRKLKREYGV